MNARTVVVTGATGFIGRHVAERLHARGLRVRACGRDARALADLASMGLSVHRGDLVHDPLDALCEGADAVVHAAALSSPWGRRGEFIAANVTATERVLAAARASGVRRFVHLSSPSIYFSQTDRRDIGEDFTPPRRWITPYAESKWLGEERVRAAASERMRAVILRPRAVFGTGDRAIFPRLIERAARGPFPLVDGGRAMIDVTHVDNVVQAVQRALDYPPPNRSDVFNITNGEPMPVKALLDTLFGALGVPVTYRPLRRDVAMAAAGLIERVARVLPGHPEPPVTRYTLGVLAYAQTLDIGAARTRLGYAPTVGVDEGIRAFAAHWTSHAAA